MVRFSSSSARSSSAITLACILGSVAALPAQTFLIITPHKHVGTVDQQKTEWDDIAAGFARFKTATGMPAEAVSLQDILDAGYGGDEPWQVKREIHVRAKVDTRYVLLVGDGGLFPVRYQHVGYAHDNSIHYIDNRDREDSVCDDPITGAPLPWCPYDSYRFHPCDAYYAHLWASDDPAKSFESWDADGDGFYGEMYGDDIRGQDEITTHPDVAIARLPCKSPQEFLAFVVKAAAYERTIAGSDREGKILLIAGTFDSSQASSRRIREVLGLTPGRSPLLYMDEEENHFIEDADGTQDCADPAAFISEHAANVAPQFMSYIGHGAANRWDEVDFFWDTAGALENDGRPAIVSTGSCTTAQFVHDEWLTSRPAVATTVTPDQESMAEGFTLNAAGGAVAYMGQVTTAQPAGIALDKFFFKAIHNGAATAGDAWWLAIEDFVFEWGIDSMTAGECIADDDYPDPARRCKIDLNPLKDVHHVYKTALFGDPSLRIDGAWVDPHDTTPPVTTGDDGPWYNKVNLESGYAYHWLIELTATDDESDIIATLSRASRNVGVEDFTAWAFRSDWIEIIDLTADLDGQYGRCDFYSINAMGNQEEVKRLYVGYDFSSPVSEVYTGGSPWPIEMNGEVTVDGIYARIEPHDNASGVRELHYRYGDGADQVTTEPIEIGGSPCIPVSATIHFWAVDKAGNVEGIKTLTIHSGAPSPGAMELCFGRRIEEFQRFPPELETGMIDLGFDEPIAGVKPDAVSFEFSGPVRAGDPAGVEWATIGAAERDITGTWNVQWDTESSGIMSDHYWVRAVLTGDFPGRGAGAQMIETEPILALVSNLGKTHYSLTAAVSGDPKLEPGGILRVNAALKNLKLEKMTNIVLSLGIDQALLAGKQGEQSLTRTRTELAQGATWTTEFELQLAKILEPVDLAKVRVFAVSDGHAYLEGGTAEFTILPVPAGLSGKVTDPKGKPIIADVVLEMGLSSKTATTNKLGLYSFADLEGGTYSLEAVLPKGYRPVSPVDGKYESVIIRGRDVVRNFILAGEDRIAPAVTEELPWALALEADLLYGTAHDDHCGTGVTEVRLAVDVPPPAGPSWVAAKSLLPLDRFLAELDVRLAALPAERRELERLKLERLKARVGSTIPVSVWTSPLGDFQRIRADGTILVAAIDGAGNEGRTSVEDARVLADFDAGPKVGTAPLAVTFTNRSTGNIEEPRWEFGDGGSSSRWSPTHTYASPGTYTVTLLVDGPPGFDAETKEALVQVTERGVVLFRRGDADGSGKVDLTDAVRSLGWLFLGDPPLPCDDAADADDNGRIEITDPIAILGYLFLGTFAIPAPGPGACGPDPSFDGLGCALSPRCD